MAQLKEDEWPDDHEPTTIEREVAADPQHGPKDPDDPRQPELSDDLRTGRSPADEETPGTPARGDTDAPKPRGRP